MALPASSGQFKGVLNTVDNSLSGQGGTVVSDMVIRLFADFQEYLDPQDTPFTSSIGSGKAVNQKKVEWLNRFLTPHTATLGTTVNNSINTFVLDAADEWKVQPTDVIKIGSEYVWVTAVASDGITLTVVRGIGSPNNNASHTAPKAIQIIGPASLENADSPIASVAKGSLEYNVPQLFDYAVQVSSREDNTPDYEYPNGNKYNGYLKQVMIEAAIDFEMAAILGKRATEGQTSTTSPSIPATPTTMGGLDFFTDGSTDLSGAALTEAHLHDELQRLYNRVKDSKIPNTVYCGPFMRRAISSLWNASRYSTTKDEKTTLVWSSIDTDFGPLKFTMSRYMPSGSLFFVNIADIKKHAYKGGEWSEVMLPVSGPYKKGRFTGDYTIAFVNNAARQKIVNASVTAADYPNM